MAIQRHEAPLVEAATALRAGGIDPVEYAETCCDRIAAVDDDLHSFVTECGRRERVREAAEALLREHPDPDDRPPLFGVPVGIKDIIHVDGLETRAGTAVPPELFAGPEAVCVEALRSAGAIVLGKTATTEFAGGGPALTRNPRDLDHTPGGSSSGSAAAVAAGLCPLALGTQTGASVIRPAAYCGCVGFKPSYGRIPRDGVLERSASADHVGLFTQDAAGLAPVARELCPTWDETGSQETLPRIGIPQATYLDTAEADTKAAFEAALEELKAAGAEVVDVTVPTLEAFDDLLTRHRRLTQAELAMVHEPWFDDWRRFYRTPMAERIEEGRQVEAGRLAECRESRLALRDELSDLRASASIDVWATPSVPAPAPATIEHTGDGRLCRPWTHAGLPAVTLPLELPDGDVPVGLQLATGHDEDEALLGWTERVSATLGIAS